MRIYGSDKPDLRIPPLHPVRGPVRRSWTDADGLPLVAIHIPEVRHAQPQGARRVQGVRTGARAARVSTTPSAWSATFPSRWPRCASACGAADDDLLMLAGWGGEPKGAPSRETVYQACGQLRLHAAQKYQRPAQAARPEEFSVPVGGGFPDVRVGRGRQPLGGGAPSVHLGARRRSGEARRPIRRAAARSRTTWC